MNPKPSMYPGFADYSAPMQTNSSGTTGSSGSDQSLNSYVNTTPTGSSNHLNYSPFTNDYNRLLTTSEKRDLEMPRELYV